MKENLNIEDIKQKMFDKLKFNNWDKVFNSFIFSSDFDKIIMQLYNLSTEGKNFTPPLKQVFRAFEECPLDKLKIVIIGQDPYPQLGVADGISFSCSNTNNLQPSLRYILGEVNKTVYGDNLVSTDVDLKRWSSQGILMLNTSLTTEVGKIGQHYDIWKDFTAYLLDYLTHNKENIIYIYMGKKAQEWADLTGDNNHKLFVSHPASAAYTKQKHWDSNDVFLKTQLLVREHYNIDIIW
jgi:uracil-DNA glycosylase